VLGCAVLAGVLDLGHRDSGVPFSYDGDGLYYLLIAKGVVDNGSGLHFPEVGAPFSLDLHDFPNFAPVHILQLHLLALGVSTPGGLLNAYFLLSFPLTIVTTLLVLRQFGCRYGPALVASL